MQYHVGIEDIEPGNWVAWIFAWPGCFSRGKTREVALEGVPAAITEMRSRLGVDIDSTAPAIINTEEYKSFNSAPDYIVNAFFENDKIPLEEADMEYANKILRLNRNDLLDTISDLPDDILDRPIDGEVQGNIRNIVRHIGTAEWWYWDRLNMAFPREQRPTDLFELLNTIRQFTLGNLPGLVGSSLITCCQGESWSPRKLLRRAVWHERVHTLQIKRYLRDM